ncbi:MAG TPA: phosphoribosyltransferase [Pyrodictium sp.]|nr:phosphoribosyltransferase [Pyrodictium sp.]HIQ56392.1 phosphoribosyltransferase [Pyrodictium sp.]
MATQHPKPTKFLTVSWHDIEEGCLNIAEKIVKNGYRVDVIVGILRGGWVPARLLSDYLGVPNVGALEIKFYRGVGETGEKPVVTQPLVVDIRDRNVLIVDDVADTGKTLNVAQNFLSLYGPKQVKTATIYVKPWSIIKPDFYAWETDAWIIFPWDKAETYEELTVARGMDVEEVAQLGGETIERVRRMLRIRHEALQTRTTR